MTSVLDDLLLALALAGCAYALLAAWLTARMLAADPAASPCPDPAPGVSMLKPLYGDEPGLVRNLRSFCLQAYPGPVEVLFGVGDPDDPAAGIARALIAEFPERDIRLVVDERRWGTNGKVSNLVNLAERARHPVIVLADSDMRVMADYLARVVAALERPGGRCRPPASTGGSRSRGSGRGSRCSGSTTISCPRSRVGTALGLAKPCFGSTIALRRATLDRIGGFHAVKDRLADDYALGEAIRGARVEGRAAARTRPRPYLRDPQFRRPSPAGAALGPHHPLARPRGVRRLPRHPSDPARNGRRDRLGFLRRGDDGPGAGCCIAATARGFRRPGARLRSKKPYSRPRPRLRGVPGLSHELLARIDRLARAPVRARGRWIDDRVRHSRFLMRTLFLQAPSFDGYDGGAAARATR